MGRIGENFRLKWDDINFDRKEFRLWTRKRKGGNWEFDWLPINEDLEKVLRDLWKKLTRNKWVFLSHRTGTSFEDEDCWLCTATSDGYSHPGIQLAIPNEKYRPDLLSNNRFSIKVQFRYLPDLLEPTFGHATNIPQAYVMVEYIKKMGIIPAPIILTPMVFFTSNTVPNIK